jgi:dTDP-4-dehydrorhamnose 3,5-epimerase
MFEKRETKIPGCFELQPIVRGDSRGKFVKTFHDEFFAENDLETNFREQYYSVSSAGVLRGLHFQLPPHGHSKVVYCTAGTILDVALDLRVGSPSYGDHISLELSADTGNMLYLPEGLAHGFYSVTEATLVYNVSTVYSPESDAGIMWNSIGMDWPNMEPELSERDTTFPAFSEFDSPFAFQG